MRCSFSRPLARRHRLLLTSAPLGSRASVNAIQPSSAHLTRAGYFETPAKAMASSRTSSSRLAAARELHHLAERLVRREGVATGWPITRSVITDVEAWLIEQPWRVVGDVGDDGVGRRRR